MCYGFVNMIGDFSPVWHWGVREGGWGGVQATYIVLPLTLHAQTHTLTQIHTHTHTHSQINSQFTEVFIYLFIYY